MRALIKKWRVFVGCWVLAAVCAVPAYAGPTPKPDITYTYQQALKRIYKEHSDVIDFEGYFKNIKAERTALRQQIALADFDEAVPLFHQLSILNKQIEGIELDEEMLERALEFNMLTILANIAMVDLDIQFMEQAVDQSETNLQRMQLLNQHGFASANQVRLAGHTHDQNQMKLDALSLSWVSELHALNKLLHHHMDLTVAVEYALGWADFDEDINAVIRSNHKNHPTVKKKELELDINNLSRAYFDRNNPSHHQNAAERTRLKNEHDKLKRELDDAKREVEAAIRNHYHLREQAINHNASLLAEKDKALHQLQTAQTNLKAGLATQFDVDQVVLAITHIEFELLKNEYVLWLQQFMYEHPFLLM